MLWGPSIRNTELQAGAASPVRFTQKLRKRCEQPVDSFRSLTRCPASRCCSRFTPHGQCICRQAVRTGNEPMAFALEKAPQSTCAHDKAPRINRLLLSCLCLTMKHLGRTSSPAKLLSAALRRSASPLNQHPIRPLRQVLSPVAAVLGGHCLQGEGQHV